jgi:hypothetical protein
MIMKIKEEDKDLNYWKENCKEDYLHTPISVLRYITELESKVNNGVLDDVSQQRELLNALADNFNESTHTYVGQSMIEETLKAFNCG